MIIILCISDYQILPEVSNVIDKTKRDILKVPTIGSQDFALKLSDDSVIEDTQDIFPDNKEINTNEDNIIVISDSSFDHSLDYFSKKKITNPVIPKNTYKSIIRSKNYALEISDDSEEDENFYEKWKNVSERNKHINKFSNYNDKATSEDKNSFFTSDDSSKNSSTSSSEHNKNTNVSKNGYNNSNILRNDKKSNRQIQNTPETEENVSPVMNTPVSNFNLLNKLTNYNSNSNTTDSKKSKACIQMTKGDLNKILKNIQSTKAIYESSKTQKVNNAVIDETLDDEMHPALLSDDSLMKRYNKPPATYIDEVPSNSDIRNQCTEINIVTSSKIHDQSVETPIDNQVKGLSERKKKEISNWLMMSSPLSYSDSSSFTNIPASSKNSISSGNSSLERLEMDYETPNNREKMKFKTSENNVIALNTNKRTSPIVPKPKTPNKFVHKPNDNTPKSSNILQKKKSNDQCKNVDTKQSNNMNVMQCTDILDKLYGEVWRDKAGALLSTPTDKQPIVMRKDRAVQTER